MESYQYVNAFCVIFNLVIQYDQKNMKIKEK